MICFLGMQLFRLCEATSSLKLRKTISDQLHSQAKPIYMKPDQETNAEREGKILGHVTYKSTEQDATNP
jgi:hypothetical protein